MEPMAIATVGGFAVLSVLCAVALIESRRTRRMVESFFGPTGREGLMSTVRYERPPVIIERKPGSSGARAERATVRPPPPAAEHEHEHEHSGPPTPREPAGERAERAKLHRDLDAAEQAQADQAPEPPRFMVQQHDRGVPAVRFERCACTS